MSETFKPRELRSTRLIGYVVGNFGLWLTNIYIDVFAFQFYVYTINLDSILVSIGISSQFILAALFSIIFGVMADNKKPGRFGKRRPFLMIGLPIWVLACIFVWLPPWYCPEDNSIFLPTAIYFWIIINIKAISGILITCVHSSMLPEQSQTQKNREKVASIGALLMIISSIIAVMMPMIIESVIEDPENVKWWQPSGVVITFFIPLIGSIFSFIGLITVILTILSVDESFHKNTEYVLKQKKSLKETFRQMMKPAKDKTFRKQLIVEFLLIGGGQVIGLTLIPFMTYVLKFRESDFLIYTIASIFGKFGGYFAWKYINEKKGLVKSYSLCILICAIASLADFIFLIEILSPGLELILFVIIIVVILGCFYGFYLFSSPLTSAIVHEAAVSTKESDVNKAITDISGAYFGLMSFLISLGPAITAFILGLILTGTNKENPIILTICFSSMGISYLISYFFLKKIKIGKDIL